MKSLPTGYRALVVGASGGIGAAAADLLRNGPGCGDCQVRLAVDRKTKRPDYLVEMLIFDEVTGLEIIHIQSLAVVSGRSHEGELVNSANIRRSWSAEAMTFKEVQTLLGELRAYSP